MPDVVQVGKNRWRIAARERLNLPEQRERVMQAITAYRASRDPLDLAEVCALAAKMPYPRMWIALARRRGGSLQTHHHLPVPVQQEYIPDDERVEPVLVDPRLSGWLGLGFSTLAVVLWLVGLFTRQ